jgi:hypothetical protein
MTASETWDLWYPKAGATGISFGRGRSDAGAEIMLVHAPPEQLSVFVRGEDGRLLAKGEDLAATDDTPMARLTRRDGTITREDIWPDAADLGRLVLLPGGEVGVLKQWWHAPDHGEWRWQIELYNRR